MNRTIKRKLKGSITQRAKDSLSIIVYVPATDGKPPRQLWETVKRLPDETDPQLRDRAERRLAELLRKQEQGQNIIAERLTVERYIGDWLTQYASDHPGSTTPLTYRYLLEKHIKPRVGHVLLPKLTARQVENVYREMRQSGLSGKTRQHVHRVLSQALKRAVRDKLIYENVCDLVDVSLHKPEPPKLHKLTPDEVRKLVDAGADYPEIAALVPLLAYSGLRIGEALGLRWIDLDFDSDTLTVEQARKRIGRGTYGAPKTEKSIRSVPLLPEVSTALYEHRQRQSQQRETDKVPDPIHHLVFTRPDGSPLDHDFVTHRWQRIRERVQTGAMNAWIEAGRKGDKPEIGRVRIHDLRYFAASTMADAGVPVHHVSAVLGHSEVTTTYNRYYRSNEDDKRRAMDTFANAIAK